MNYNIINVVDIESTCWIESQKALNTSEIIEIGISELEVSTGNILSSESIYVIPKISTISDFCYNLTGITQKILDSKAISFSKACNILQEKYKSKDRVWASYGHYDLRMFDEQCYRENINYPFGGKHINIKTLFALKYKLKKEIGMDSALKYLNLVLEGRHHSGKDDSHNIAKILKEILK